MSQVRPKKYKVGKVESMSQVLIDMSFICLRGFHAHHKIDKSGKITGFCNSEGIGTGMAFGAIGTLFYLFSKYRWSSSDTILIWDGWPKRKHQVYPDYKKGRRAETFPRAMSVSIQFKITKVILALCGLTYGYSADYESDDVIATLCQGRDSTIVSNDHDLNQCLTERTSVLHLQSVGEERFGQADFQKSYGIFPEDYAYVQALGGCTTDKVPGMTGVGEDTALKLVKLNRWDRLISNSPEIVFPDKRAETVFRKNHSTWNYSRDYELVALRKDVPVELMRHEPRISDLRKWFVRLAFSHYLIPENFNKIIKAFGG